MQVGILYLDMLVKILKKVIIIYFISLYKEMMKNKYLQNIHKFLVGHCIKNLQFFQWQFSYHFANTCELKIEQQKDLQNL